MIPTRVLVSRETQTFFPQLNIPCNPTNDINFQFNYCPTLSAAILFTVLFSLVVIAHVFQAWHYGKKFCWVLIMGGIWEFISSATRIAAIKSPYDSGVYSTSFVFLVLAPLWINAFCYMILGRLVNFYLAEKKLAGIKATRMAMVFVGLDITSFIIQLIGALTTVGTNKSAQTVKNGLHIYTAGVCIQQAVIGIFAILCFIFQRKLKVESTVHNKRKATYLILTLYACLTLITFRIIFRILEFSAGATSSIHYTVDDNEWYMYVFDEMPMFFALIVFNLYHPGLVLFGPDSEYRTKEHKAAAKEEKNRIKLEKRAAKAAH